MLKARTQTRPRPHAVRVYVLYRSPKGKESEGEGKRLLHYCGLRSWYEAFKNGSYNAEHCVRVPHGLAARLTRCCAAGFVVDVGALAAACGILSQRRRVLPAMSSCLGEVARQTGASTPRADISNGLGRPRAPTRLMLSRIHMHGRYTFVLFPSTTLSIVNIGSVDPAALIG